MRAIVDASDLHQVERLWRLAGKAMPEAVQQTINRVGPPALTQVRRALARQTSLPYRRVMNEVAPSRWATIDNPTFDIRGRGRQIGLREFSASQTRAGVRVTVWGRSQLLRGAFMGEAQAGYRDVFKRIGGRRERRTKTDPETGKVTTYTTELPIKKLYGPAVPVEMVKGASLAAFQNTAHIRLPIEAAKQVAKILGRGRLADRRRTA